MSEYVKNGQTCLEKTGIECRNEELVKNTYGKTNEYSAIHPDALSNGDVNGKGVGGNHTAYLPDCSKPKNLYDYSNFNTTNGGGKYDVEGRNGIGGRLRAQVSSLYNENYQYGANLINSAVNRDEGQIIINW